MDFRKSIKVLRRWRWTFLAVWSAAFCLVVFAPENNVQPVPIYKSSAKILLTPSTSSSASFRGAGSLNHSGDVARSWFADPTIIEELIMSEELLTRVQANSGMDLSWDRLRGMISIEPVQEGRMSFGQLKLFRLSVTAGDPVQSEKLTRLVTDEFMAYVQELSAREFANTRRFVEELVDEAEQRRMAAEEALLRLKEKYADSPAEASIQAEEAALESERRAVNVEVTTLKGRLAAVRDYIDGRSSSAPWEILNKQDGSLAGLEANVSQLKLELAKAREVYTDENSKVKMLKARLSRAQQIYQEDLNHYVESLYQSTSSELKQKMVRSQALTRQLTVLASSRMSDDDRRQAKKLERQMTLWDENHLSLTQQLYQARVVEQSSRRQGSVNVLEKPRRGAAITPLGPSSTVTSKKKKMASGLLLGLVLGIGAAFLREFLSASMRLRPRIEEALELPVIAVIPATPSELTVDWERFKRPNSERLNELVLAHSGEPSRGRDGKSFSNGHSRNGKNGRSH